MSFLPFPAFPSSKRCDCFQGVKSCWTYGISYLYRTQDRKKENEDHESKILSADSSLYFRLKCQKVTFRYSSSKLERMNTKTVFKNVLLRKRFRRRLFSNCGALFEQHIFAWCGGEGRGGSYKKSRWRMGWRIPNPNRTAGEQYQGNRWSRERATDIDIWTRRCITAFGPSVGPDRDRGIEGKRSASLLLLLLDLRGATQKTKKGEPTRLEE